MAKTKQDYFAQGQADAVEARPRAMYKSGTWQASAYDQGYNAAVAEAQAKIANTKAVTTAQQSKVWLDTQRRVAAEQERNARLARIRGLTAAPAKRNDFVVSHNIIRAR